MPLKINNSLNIAFSRNPIVVSHRYDEPLDKNGGLLDISIGGSHVFKCRFSDPLEMDISEIVDAYIPLLPEPDVISAQPVQQVFSFLESGKYDVMCHLDYASIENEFEFKVMPGGISRQNYRRYAALGTDVFTEKFFESCGNFFMTTRTAEWRISMKETELSPLYFIIARQNEDIEIKAATTGQSLYLGTHDPGIYTLDFDELRRKATIDHQLLPNIFDVYRNETFACRIVIERADIAKERYRLRFRNALGVFEIIELTGELSFTPDYSEAEEATFQCFDPVTYSLYSDRERIERKQSISIAIGAKRADEVRFLMDMIASEEVYLLDVTPFPLKVIPSAEELEYRPRPTAPESFTLKLEISDSETCIMQDIIDGTTGCRPRVFTKQFTNQFN